MSADIRERRARLAFGTWHIATGQQPPLADRDAKGWSVVAAWYALTDNERAMWFAAVDAVATLPVPTADIPSASSGQAAGEVAAELDRRTDDIERHFAVLLGTGRHMGRANATYLVEQLRALAARLRGVATTGEDK